MVAKGDFGEIGLCTSIPQKYKDGPKKGEYILDNWIACLKLDGFCTYSTTGLLNLRFNQILGPEFVEKGDWNGCKSGDTVKMIIDCENWTAELYNNGKFNVRVKIAKNSKHYLIMGGDRSNRKLSGVFHWKLLD